MKIIRLGVAQAPSIWSKVTCEKRRASREKVKLLYEANGVSTFDKIKTITSRVHGVSYVTVSEQTMEKIKIREANSFGDIPVCLVQTQYSISYNRNPKGASTGIKLTIIDCDV